MLVFAFSGLAIQAVGRCAQDVVNEVRRQFSERPGIMDGSQKPDYNRCVSIVTEAAEASVETTETSCSSHDGTASAAAAAGAGAGAAGGAAAGGAAAGAADEAAGLIGGSTVRGVLNDIDPAPVW